MAVLTSADGLSQATSGPPVSRGYTKHELLDSHHHSVIAEAPLTCARLAEAGSRRSHSSKHPSMVPTKIICGWCSARARHEKKPSPKRTPTGADYLALVHGVLKIRGKGGSRGGGWERCLISMEKGDMDKPWGIYHTVIDRGCATSDVVQRSRHPAKQRMSVERQHMYMP